METGRDRILWPLWPRGWLPGWELQRRVARLLCRDLILAVRGYGQCVATAQPTAVTNRLIREINALLARLRNGSPDAEKVLGEMAARAQVPQRGAIRLFSRTQ